MPPERSTGVVHGGGIQREQFVIAAAVQRQLFHLALVDQARGLLRRCIDSVSGGIHLNLLLHSLDTEHEIQLQALPDGERDATPFLGRESIMRN